MSSSPNPAQVSAQNTALWAILRYIYTHLGHVCDHYEICEHQACADSNAAREIADAALHGWLGRLDIHELAGYALDLSPDILGEYTAQEHPMIPTPDELEAEIKKSDQPEIGRVTQLTLEALRKVWPPTLSDQAVIGVPPRTTQRIRLAVERLFEQRGWRLHYTDDQRDGAFWHVSRTMPTTRPYSAPVVKGDVGNE